MERRGNLSFHDAFAHSRFDIDNPHSGLGRMKEYDREEWLLKYKDGL